MIHLYATAGSGRYPVCGAPVSKGPVASAYEVGDTGPNALCLGCRAYQARKSSAIMEAVRRKRGKT